MNYSVRIPQNPPAPFEKGDSGNEITIKLACESAKLMCENAVLDNKKGFLTPTTAFGELLIERINKVGISTAVILMPEGRKL